MNYEDLRKKASVIVEESVKSYLEGKTMKFLLMIMGAMHYGIKANPEAMHNYNIILEEIYNYYRNHPNIPVDKMLFSSLNKFASIVSDTEDSNLCMGYIFSQLENEKKNIAPFNLDVKTIIDSLKNRIATLPKLSNNPEINFWLEETDKILREKYGYMILWTKENTSGN